MEKYFCYGKKDFCDSIDKCQFCKFFDGMGCVDGELAHSILSGIFGEDYDLDRLKELVQADRDNRIIIPPVNIGDTVYVITTCENFIAVPDGTIYGEGGELGTATGYYCPCDLARNCPFPLEEDGSFDCKKHKNTSNIFKDLVVGIVVDEMRDCVVFEYSGAKYFEEFGKRFFLSQKEAEAALEKMKDRDKQ